MKKNIVLIVIFTVLFSCNTSKETAYYNSDFQINFGNSGGFTNNTMEYLINGDGAIFKVQENEKLYVKSLKKKDLKKLKESFLENDFKNIELNHPGNLSYFIAVKSIDYKNTIKWSDSNDSEKAELLYKNLLSTIKD
ncbi:MAG: hypothetical protein PF541_09025 [Prolixibacteraceae bacterium]|jgi:hypothetical protein|nr:hypothetical protein [Prolixibacteraceae bacterium]